MSPGSPRVESSFEVSKDGYGTHSRLVSESGHSLVVEDLHVSVPTDGLDAKSNELCNIVERMPRSMNIFQFLQTLSPHLEGVVNRSMAGSVFNGPCHRVL